MATNHLWKVTSKRNVGKVPQGAWVEIIKTGTTARPSQKEIQSAVKQKYRIDISESLCNTSHFDAQEV